MKRTKLVRKTSLQRGGKGLKRGGSKLTRTGWIKASIPKERGNPAYRAWIRTWPCHLYQLGWQHMFPGQTECAHVKTKRLARGRDNDGDTGNTLPLCPAHHAEQHAHGIQSFRRKYSVDLKLIAEAYAVLWGQR
ncbi:MAG: hypothetical protein PHS14_16530 [Elusimicrobia bacterium]|nr:hypothetical protein [Elusimicrobiota bacterium]